MIHSHFRVLLVLHPNADHQLYAAWSKTLPSYEFELWGRTKLISCDHCE